MGNSLTTTPLGAILEYRLHCGNQLFAPWEITISTLIGECWSRWTDQASARRRQAIIRRNPACRASRARFGERPCSWRNRDQPS